MNLQLLQRATLDYEGAPSRQLYKHADGTLYWDLDYLHIALATHGALRHKFHWLQQVKDICKAFPFLADIVHVYTASRDTPPGCLRGNVCSTLALCSFFWGIINSSKLEPLVKNCGVFLVNIAARACEVLPAEGDCLHLQGHILEIRRPGIVTGFWELLGASHANLASSWANAWDSLRLLGILETDRAASSHVRDIVVFLAWYRKSRRINKQPKPSPLASQILDDLSFAFVKWLAGRMDGYVTDMYMPNHESHQPPPALRHLKGTKYVKVSTDAIWNLMEKANSTGTSLAGAIALKSDDATLGCSPSMCDLWMNKLQQMYTERASLGFLNVSHFNIVADGSTHSCQDTLVSLAYSWEQDLAVCLTIQRIQPGQHVTMLDQDMPGEIAILAAKRKLERVSAFRQMQSLSHQISLLTKGRLTIDSFKLDDSVHLQPVAPGEIRVVRCGGEGMTDIAVIIKADQTFVQVLPDGFADSLLLLVNLDQGSIGAAGMAFGIHHKELMAVVRFDKFHRIIRDVKLSLKHCCGGVFLKTQLFSSYVYGLNYKPFNSGGFSQVKARLLQVFLATEDIRSDIWLKYCDRIALDLAMPCQSDQDHEALWAAVACLPSYSQKGSLPKLGQWFSWNGCAHEQMKEFSATKMLFEHHLECGELDPDLADAFNGLVAAGEAPTPAAQLAALKNISGGLSLAYKLMSSALQAHTKILYAVTKPCWDWYTAQVTDIKTPADGLRYSARMAEGRWAKEPHLWQTLSTLCDESALVFMGFPQGGGAGSLDSTIAHETLMLAWQLVSHRVWSLSRHAVPPECFAAATSSDHTISQRVVDSMKQWWKNLIMLEQRVNDVPAAKQLWNDLDFAKSQPIRLLFAFFERDQWRCQSRAGRKLLSGLLNALPDNKIVEDAHGAIRRESLGNANSKLTSARIQDVVMRSGVFSSRGIPHPALVTANVFHSKFKLLRPKCIASSYKAATHKLPSSWTAMWGKRTWKPLTEEGNHTSQAAWIWLHARAQLGLATRLALWSKLVPCFTLIARVADGEVYASMGNATWAVLGWPMKKVATNDDGWDSYVFQPGAAVEWLHVTGPMDWAVIPLVGERCAMGIVLKQIADRVPLMRYSLLHHSRTLSHKDLSECAAHLALDVGTGPSRLDLLKALASHFGHVCHEEQKTTDAAASIAKDPLAEAVYGDMDKAEQMEFPEVDAAFKQKRERQRIAEWRVLKLSVAVPGAKKRRLSGAPKKKGRKKQRVQSAPDAPGGPGFLILGFTVSVLWFTVWGLGLHLFRV